MMTENRSSNLSKGPDVQGTHFLVSETHHFYQSGYIVSCALSVNNYGTKLIYFQFQVLANILSLFK